MNKKILKKTILMVISPTKIKILLSFLTAIFLQMLVYYWIGCSDVSGGDLMLNNCGFLGTISRRLAAFFRGIYWIPFGIIFIDFLMAKFSVISYDLSIFLTYLFGSYLWVSIIPLASRSIRKVWASKLLVVFLVLLIIPTLSTATTDYNPNNNGKGILINISQTNPKL